VDIVDGGAGNDKLYGLGGADVLEGGPGNDLLVGDYVEVYSDGSMGNFDADNSVNTYIYNLNDGNDTIVDASTNDTHGKLVFGPGITPDMITLSRSGNNLTFNIGNGGGSVTIYDWYTTESTYPNSFTFTLAQIQFDGQDPQDAVTFVSNTTVTGTASNDIIHGTSVNDVLSGGAGNDRIYGEGGDDTLFGDTGNDILMGGIGANTLEGGPGDDLLVGDYVGINSDGSMRNFDADNSVNTYIYNLNDGNDTIVDASTNDTHGKLVFGPGITPDMITLSRSGENLIFSVGNNKGSVTVYSWFSTISTYPNTFTFNLAQIQFDGQSAQSISDFASARTIIVTGTDGNDHLHGTSFNDSLDSGAGDDFVFGNSGNDSLEGGPGNDLLMGGDGSDTLHGGAGDDLLVGSSAEFYNYSSLVPGTLSNCNSANIYMFNLNDGHDTIIDFSSTAANHGTLKFGSGIQASNLVLTKSGLDLVITINANDSVTIYEWFAGDTYELANIQFDGQSPQDAVTFVNAHLSP